MALYILLNRLRIRNSCPNHGAKDCRTKNEDLMIEGDNDPQKLTSNEIDDFWSVWDV